RRKRSVDANETVRSEVTSDVEAGGVDAGRDADAGRGEAVPGERLGARRGRGAERGELAAADVEDAQAQGGEGVGEIGVGEREAEAHGAAHRIGRQRGEAEASGGGVDG